jgi:formylglycine-generating enzyme required for sulfatase activity
LGDPFPQVRAAAITALLEIGSEDAWEVLANDLVYECFVPAGEFLMGAVPQQLPPPDYPAVQGVDLQANPSEQPQRRIALGAYFIDRHPVTNAAYARFLADTPDYPTHGHTREVHPLAESANLPVVNLSWQDARAYARWAGKRLPTEAEWEKAARGEDGRSFPWRGTFHKGRCNTAEGGLGGVTAVGRFSSSGGDSPYGVADMCGNVWEWTQDWYAADTYRLAPRASNPTGPPEGEHKVLRGGSFRESSERSRTFSRFWRKPRLRRDDFGFRCAFTPPGSPDGVG